MKYTVRNENPDQPLLERLFAIRNISDPLEHFLNPTYGRYWQPTSILPDIDKAVTRIAQAMKSQEKIMVFGDYDVDGICSTYIVYTAFRQFFNYDNVSLRLPHRMLDGYGIKSYHLDEILAQWCSLVITVDNGITAVEESLHATEIGLDMVITDHHTPLDKLPQATALVNPQLNADCFAEICGAAVAFKVMMAIADELELDRETKQRMFEYFLPFTAMATIADCMPLINENRLIVTKGFDLINNHKSKIAPSLRHFLDHLWLSKIDTYHVGFQIGPRLNATGRMSSALDGLNCFLAPTPQKQRLYIDNMEQLNTDRRELQSKMLSTANELIDPDKNFMAAASEEFHKGIVGIVAGRIAEKHYKPTAIFEINKEKNVATASLRGPDYFNIVDMLKSADDLLLKYGGHEQAWGLTVSLDNLDGALERFHAYCDDIIVGDKLEKSIEVDTPLYTHELSNDILNDVTKLWPYGEGNPEPKFILNDVVITQVSKVGSKGNGHLKLKVKHGDKHCNIMQWKKWDQSEILTKGQSLDIIGKVKEDTYNGWYFVEGSHLIEQ